MKIAYITAHAPYGTGETFILTEMNTLLQLGIELTIIPRNPPRDVFHKAENNLVEKTVWFPLIDFRILRSFLGTLIKQRALWHIVYLLMKHSRSPQILIKNLAILPKATHLCQLFNKDNIAHIHAHWGSTTATMAWVISDLTGIPWSMTLHRWDITEDNMLGLKVARALFTRCISENGRKEVMQITGSTCAEKVKVLHIGVNVPPKKPSIFHLSEDVFSIACPANLIPVKGHRYLIKACAQLKRNCVKDFRCFIIGDGPLEADIQRQIAQHDLLGNVRMCGRLPHNELMCMYETGKVHVVVLPSIVTEDGEKEGIPVALMEAMAYGIPVVSTSTGSIPELLSEGAGIMVKEKDSDALANALFLLSTDTMLYLETAEKGYNQIKRHFNVKLIVSRLIAEMARQ